MKLKMLGYGKGFVPLNELSLYPVRNGKLLKDLHFSQMTLWRIDLRRNRLITGNSVKVVPVLLKRWMVKDWFRKVVVNMERRRYIPEIFNKNDW